MRTLAVLVLLAPLVAVFAVVAGRTVARDAEACGTGPVQFENAVQQAHFVVIGRAIAVGDNSNRFPRVVDTPNPISADASVDTAQTPPYPTPTLVPTDLSGIGATLEVQRALVGQASTEVAIDGEARASAERHVRAEESAGYPQACGAGFAVIRYEAGRDYLAMSGNESWPYGSIAWPVQEGWVLFEGFPSMALSMDSFEAYFGRFEGASGSSDGEVTIEEGRVPLEDMVQFIEALRGGGGSFISPPETGSGGLRGTQ